MTTTNKFLSGTSQRYYKSEPITPSEARRVAESRNTYPTAADAVRAGLLRLPVKRGDL